MLLLTALVRALCSTSLNNRPVIGVLYQPIDPSLLPLCPTCTSYVVSSYVQWLQGAGARVALYNWNSSDEVLAAGFKEVRYRNHARSLRPHLLVDCARIILYCMCSSRGSW